MTAQLAVREPINRRHIIRGAAWSLPVIAAAVAAPAAAASVSSPLEVGAFSLNGSCGTLGVLGPGFILTAGPTALPAGTTILVSGSGVANIGVFSVTGGTASVAVASPSARSITLTTPLPAGATLAVRTTLSISVAFTLDAVASIPDGYAATEAKTTAAVNSTLATCSAN